MTVLLLRGGGLGNIIPRNREENAVLRLRHDIPFLIPLGTDNRSSRVQWGAEATWFNNALGRCPTYSTGFYLFFFSSHRSTSTSTLLRPNLRAGSLPVFFVTACGPLMRHTLIPTFCISLSPDFQQWG